MSYDVNLTIDTGGSEPRCIGAGHNYTYNCAPMFRLALGGDGINDLHCMKASAAIPRLRAAVAHMQAPENAEAYAAMNPANGWGHHTSATEFLREILRDCEANPLTTIIVS